MTSRYGRSRLVVLDGRLELVVLRELRVRLVLAEDPRELAPDAAVPVDKRAVAVERRPALHGPDFTGGRQARTIPHIVRRARPRRAGCWRSTPPRRSREPARDQGGRHVPRRRPGRLLRRDRSRALRLPTGSSSPACGTLMAYPDKPPPAGLAARAGARRSGAGRLQGRQDVHVHDPQGRALLRRQAGDGARVRARARANPRSCDEIDQRRRPRGDIVGGAGRCSTARRRRPPASSPRGRTLTLRLTKPIADFPPRRPASAPCPPTLPVDPEGAKAPLPSAAPYYVAQYVPGERLVLERNRFYKGRAASPRRPLRRRPERGRRRSIVDAIASGKLDCGLRPPDIADRGAELAQRYGVNKPGGQFFVEPGSLCLRMFVLNTSRPLFKNNPKLRQAVNFAVDRKALTRELGAVAGTPTDQYLRLLRRASETSASTRSQDPTCRRRARSPKGHTRGGKAVLYTRPDPPADVAQAQILQREPEAIGLEVEIVQFPASLHLREAGHAAASRSTSAESAGAAWSARPIRHSSTGSSTGARSADAPTTQNWSYFNSPKYNRLLDEASRLTGADALPGLRRARRHDLERRRARDPLRGPQRVDVRLRQDRLRRHEPEPRPDRGLPQVTRALAATIFAALVLIPTAGTHGIKEGGTFRMAVTPAARFGAIDPALYGIEGRLLRPACGALVSYPDKPLPAGLQLAPELAEDYPMISKDRRTYTFTIRRDARFSNGTPATAQAFVRALERIFTPAMQPDASEFFVDILGARKMLAGKTTTLAGAVAKGRVLRLRLTTPVPDLPTRLTQVCAVPPTLPADPEGAKAPLPSPSPYYVSQYVPGELVVMERNRFYRGPRPHHVDRITIELDADASVLERVEKGELDTAAGTPDLNPQLADLVKRYGKNRSRVFVEPDTAQAHDLRQHDAAAVQEQRETAAGAQLRREPARPRAGVRPLHRDSHGPVPTARHAGVPRRTHLPGRRPGSSPGEGAGRGHPALRQGRHLYVQRGAARLHRRPAGPPAEPEIDRSRRRDPEVPVSGPAREAGDAGRAVRAGLAGHGRPLQRPGTVLRANRNHLPLQLAEVRPAADSRRPALRACALPAPTASSTSSLRETQRRRSPR